MAVNYNMDVVSPMQQALSGYNNGVLARKKEEETDARKNLAERQAEEVSARIAKMEEDQARLQKGQQRLGQVAQSVKDGTWTPEDFYSLQVEYPDYAEHVASVYEGMSDEKKQNGVGMLQRIAVAAETDPETAKALLEEEAIASENAGDELSAKAARAQAVLLEKNPELFMTGVLAQLSGGMDKDQFEAFSEVIRPEPKVDPVEQQRFENQLKLDEFNAERIDADRDYSADRADANRDYALERDKFDAENAQSDRDYALERDKFEAENADDEGTVSEIPKKGRFPAPTRLSTEGLNDAGNTAVYKNEAASLREIRETGRELKESAATMDQFIDKSKGYWAQGEGIINDLGQATSMRTSGLKSLTAKLAPSERPEGSGSTSDKDMDLYKSATVSINNTPSANKQIRDVRRAMSDNNDAYLAFLEEYTNDYGRGSLEAGKQLWRKYSDAEPIYDQETGLPRKDRQPIAEWLGEDEDVFATPSSGEPEDGARAVNPETGEVIELRNGKWVPVK